jgi:hypothetical protein
MPRKHTNTQLFALRESPPAEIDLVGRRYRRVRVFKHDFWAATCLYELAADGEQPDAAAIPKVVVKFGRTQPLCGVDMSWYGRWMHAHEKAIYRDLKGVRGVPRWAGEVSETAYAMEYIESRPLDHEPPPPEGFFDELRTLFDEIHGRGVGYCDANKRSNILVADDGRPFLVDYQISIRRRDDLPRPLRNIVAAAVRYIAQKDLYHLYKHKRRISPAELTGEEEVLSRRPGGLHGLHRRLTKHWRRLRRSFLSRQHDSGRLHSPSADLEDHHQPEKATWRKTDGEES